MKLLVSLDWRGRRHKVGLLHVFETRGRERYRFSYDRAWVDDPLGFAIDPALELSPYQIYSSANLWGVFQDISPDRWGRLVQDRVRKGFVSESGYLLGVSDYMRMGALRLSTEDAPETFLAVHQDVPELVHLRALENAVQRLEAGQETSADLAMLAQPGSSLGGARPKAAIEDEGQLWIAKFQSRADTERVCSWEAVMLDMARQAGMSTAPFRVLNADSDRPVLLARRFDRDGQARIPFMSAMTLLERDESSRDTASYLELADAISRYSSRPREDKRELWLRMTFNALAGNTDDHLRNHGFLRDPQGWYLSPAYDLNPSNHPHERRTHALSFDGHGYRPSLATCRELAPSFDVNEPVQAAILGQLGRALANWRATARRYGLTADEIQRMATAFEHADTRALLALPSPAQAPRGRRGPTPGN